MLKGFLLSLLLFSIGNQAASAQATKPDTAFLANAIQNLQSLYQESLDTDSHLFNGSEYIDPDKYYLTGHSFFSTNQEIQGSIMYDGVLYRKVPMRYDIMSDVVVMQHPESTIYFKLVSEKIKLFTLANHTFVRLEADSLGNSPIRTGFYDLLADGQVKVLAKRTKTAQEKAQSTGMTGQFDEHERYFVKKGLNYHQVKSKNSVINLFPEQKKELQKYARSNKLNFRKGRELSIVKLVQFYESLPKTAVSPAG